MNVNGESRAELVIDISALASIRALVESVGTRAGLSEDAVINLVLAVHELVTNVIRHSDGGGRVAIWPTVDGVVCQVSDSGPGMSKPSYNAPEPGAVTGRGLWMIQRMTDKMEIETGPHGTTVTISMSGPVRR